MDVTVSMPINREALWALAFRLVGTVVPSPEELGVPESVVDLISANVDWYWSPDLPEW